MAESIVKVPSTASGEMDFLAFSFNGKHSWDDFGIYRVGDGGRYNENLSPAMADKTAENPGGDGMYFFGTNHKQKDFNINFAFDHLTDPRIREMKKWLNGKEMGDLWFEEAPYKVWTAKVTGQPNIKYIPFDDFDEQGNKIRVYRGEGSIVFTAYWPYAHTPEAVWTLNHETKDGKALSAYTDFYNKEQWAAASGLTEKVTPNLVVGDLPTYFTIKLPGLASYSLLYPEDNETHCIGYKIHTPSGSAKVYLDFPNTITTIGRPDGVLDNDGYYWRTGSGDSEGQLLGIYAVDLSKTSITEIPEYCFNKAPVEFIKLPKNLAYLGSFFASGTTMNNECENSELTSYLTSKGLFFEGIELIPGESKTLCKLGSIDRQKETYTIQPGTKFLSSYCCHQAKFVHLTVPDGVLGISAGAFQQNEELQDIILPETLTHIGRYAFALTPAIIYYLGNGSKWKLASVGGILEESVSNTTYFYSKNRPTENSANYWHYDDNGKPTPWTEEA